MGRHSFLQPASHAIFGNGVEAVAGNGTDQLTERDAEIDRFTGQGKGFGEAQVIENEPVFVVEQGKGIVERFDGVDQPMLEAGLFGVGRFELADQWPKNAEGRNCQQAEPGEQGQPLK